MKHYETQRKKKPFELLLLEKGIDIPDIMYICRLSMPTAQKRIREETDWKAREIKALKEHYGMTKEEAWDLFIEKGGSN